jgi:hypothetical protein
MILVLNLDLFHADSNEAFAVLVNILRRSPLLKSLDLFLHPVLLNTI